MNKLNITVSGINNKTTETSLKNALKKIEGINSIGYDNLTSNLEISYNDPADESQIKNCIFESGFKLS